MILILKIITSTLHMRKNVEFLGIISKAGSSIILCSDIFNEISNIFRFIIVYFITTLNMTASVKTHSNNKVSKLFSKQCLITKSKNIHLKGANAVI
jgi:hypothetical protein